MTNWKDTTSYRRGERGTVEPSCWMASGVLVHIIVHRYHGCGDAWFVTCRQANIDAAGLEGPTLEAAKRQAIDAVRTKLRRLADDADSITNAEVDWRGEAASGRTTC